MRKITRLVIFLIILTVHDVQAQDRPIPILGFSEFQELIHKESDSIYVINFWATWCGPCRRELPEFEKIHQAYSHEKVKVLLVSLDFPSQIDKGLKAFLKNTPVTAQVILLNDPDANAWIDKVEPTWTGSLPATLVCKGPHRLFFEKELHFQDIDNSIQSFINL